MSARYLIALDHRTIVGAYDAAIGMEVALECAGPDGKVVPCIPIAEVLSYAIGLETSANGLTDMECHEAAAHLRVIAGRLREMCEMPEEE